jgi:hypothetical protein
MPQARTTRLEAGEKSCLFGCLLPRQSHLAAGSGWSPARCAWFCRVIQANLLTATYYACLRSGTSIIVKEAI